MINRLIKTEKDNEKVLSRIEQLMNAEPGTAEMDELELLTALVEMYEDRHYPISPPDPIAAIKFRMEQLGLTQKDMVPHRHQEQGVRGSQRQAPVDTGHDAVAQYKFRSIGRGTAERAGCRFPGRNAGSGMAKISCC